MDAYVDLSYLFHIITLCNIPYYFKKILNIKVSKIELVSFFVFSIVLYFNVFIFRNYPYLNLLFLLVYFLLIYHKRFIKPYLVYLFIYYSNIATSMIFTTNIYLINGLVFLNTPSSIFFVITQLMNIIFIELIMFTIRSIKLLKNYRVKIKIKFKDEYSDFSGYIDSGNTLLVDGLPVIFLKDSYFTEDSYKEMIVNGVGKR